MRWKILDTMPFVADVMVNIAVEPKPCPAASSLRPQEDIEQVGEKIEKERDEWVAITAPFFGRVAGLPRGATHRISQATQGRLDL